MKESPDPQGRTASAPGDAHGERQTSFVKAACFVFAVVANVNYLVFILNPVHAGNLAFWLLSAVADTIVGLIFLGTWGMALFFELSKARYARNLRAIRAAGAHLVQERVAVLVTVVNEDLDVVRSTLEHALRLTGDKTVYLLDDGKSEATRHLAESVGVVYVTRSDRTGFKAGNVNNALAHHVREPYALVVDADFALDPTFLERTLPLFSDARVAAVQTPQVYGNADTLFSRGCKHLQDIFYAYLQPGRQLLGSSFCVGTNVIFRVSALREVGGLREMHSEDIFTTVALLERGYTVSFLDEALAVGLSPTTLTSFYTQQNRWARGGFLMMLRHNTLFNRRLTFAQRVQFFASNFFYLSGLSVLIYLASPAIAILFDVASMRPSYWAQWSVAYALFFAANFGLATALLKNHRIASWVLSVFLFVPYLAALGSTIVSLRPFQWRVTHAPSRGLITKLLVPHIAFVTLAIAIASLLAAHVLAIHAILAFYYAWLAVDFILVVPFVIYGYAAAARAPLASGEKRSEIDRSAAERTA